MRNLLLLLTLMRGMSVSAQTACDIPSGWHKSTSYTWKSSDASLHKYKYKDYALSSYAAKSAVQKTPVKGYEFSSYEEQRILNYTMHMGLFFKSDYSKMMMRCIISGDTGIEHVWVFYTDKFDVELFEDAGYLIGCEGIAL